MQIKPSHFEMHEKVEKPVIQPHLPKVSRTSQKQLAQVQAPPSSAFSKKRHSFLNLIEAVKEDNKEDKTVIHPVKLKPAITSQKKVESKKFEKEKEKAEGKKETPKNLLKPQIRKKALTKGKKLPTEAKLEICSEEVKKKATVEKKEKKTEKPKK